MNYPTSLQIGDHTHEVVYETAKKRTSSVRFRKGKVVLRLSKYMFAGQRDKMVKEFLTWAEKKLNEVEVGDFVMPNYGDGGRVCTHNKAYEIEAVTDQRRKNASSRLLDG